MTFLDAQLGLYSATCSLEFPSNLYLGANQPPPACTIEDLAIDGYILSTEANYKTSCWKHIMKQSDKSVLMEHPYCHSQKLESSKVKSDAQLISESCFTGSLDMRSRWNTAPTSQVQRQDRLEQRTPDCNHLRPALFVLDVSPVILLRGDWRPNLVDSKILTHWGPMSNKSPANRSKILILVLLYKFVRRPLSISLGLCFAEYKNC